MWVASGEVRVWLASGEMCVCGWLVECACVVG